MLKVYYEGDLRTRAVDEAHRHEIKTDASKGNGGKDEFMSPTDLVAAALGTCVLTLMGIEAKKLKVDLKGLRLEVEKKMADSFGRKFTSLVTHVFCPHTFDAEIQQKIELAGSRCPVHQSLHPDIKQEFFFHWGEA